MTRIWCWKCHKTNFETFPPTSQQVLDHIRIAHGLEAISNDRRAHADWREHQSLIWRQQRVRLQGELDAHDLANPDDVDEDTIIVGGALREREREEMLGKLRAHLEVHDDGDGEEDEELYDDDELEEIEEIHNEVDDNDFGEVDVGVRSRSCLIVGPPGGREGYRTLADRSSQATTAVERIAAGGVHQQMFVPPASKGVGWDVMAFSGFEPVGAREAREARGGLEQSESIDGNGDWMSAGVQAVSQVSPDTTPSPDVEEAARILLSIGQNELRGIAGSRAGGGECQKREVEAANALLMLNRQSNEEGNSSRTPDVGESSSTSKAIESSRERVRPGLEGAGTKDEPMVID